MVDAWTQTSNRGSSTEGPGLKDGKKGVSIQQTIVQSLTENQKQGNGMKLMSIEGGNT